MKLFVLVLAVATTSGCSFPFHEEDGVERICGPDVSELPCGAGVETARAYPFDLLVHCGVEWAYFDGRYWVPRPRVDPESDWDPIERGTMTLVGPDEARFEGAAHGEARFVPAPVTYRPRPCA